MKPSIVAGRYAEALVDYAKGDVGLKELLEEANLLSKLLKSCPELQKILFSPQITTTEKFSFLDSTLKDYFSEDIVLFLKLIIEKKRISLLPNMLDYIRTNYSHGRALDVLLRSAHPLNQEDANRIKDKLEARFKNKVHISRELDLDLIGGVQVIVGNTVIDGSIRRRIKDLREKINTIRMV